MMLSQHKIAYMVEEVKIDTTTVKVLLGDDWLTIKDAWPNGLEQPPVHKVSKPPAAERGIPVGSVPPGPTGRTKRPRAQASHCILGHPP